jgi:integrase
LNEQEVEKLCQHLRELPDTFKTVRLRAIVALLLLQGLRTVEICRLDVADVDIANGRLQVLGKGRDDKEHIFLHPQTVKALRTYQRSSQMRDETLPLFTSLWGKTKDSRLTTRGLRHIVKELLAELSIEKSVHGFRHTFVTTLVKSYKSDLLRVAKYSRHRSVETLQVYNDSLIDKQDLAKYYGSFTVSIN